MEDRTQDGKRIKYNPFERKAVYPDPNEMFPNACEWRRTFFPPWYLKLMDRFSQTGHRRDNHGDHIIRSLYDLYGVITFVEVKLKHH